MNKVKKVNKVVHKKPEFTFFMQPTCITDARGRIENDKTWNKMMELVY